MLSRLGDGFDSLSYPIQGTESRGAERYMELTASGHLAYQT